jgi:hypothetical protein
MTGARVAAARSLLFVPGDRPDRIAAHSCVTAHPSVTAEPEE